jgi:enamine deaminase RidA (YjgF/YER057c/UK114 family)
MTKLNQVIALVNGKKTRAKEELTQVYKMVQKPEVFTGISRVYQPSDDEGETIPPENKLPQFTTKQMLSVAQNTLTSLIDIVATQDRGNTEARADVVVDDNVLVKDVPVTHLLFLEKQLVDIHTLISALPTLDPAERWVYDENRGCHVTEPTRTNRTKKVMRNHVKAPATDKHPAQVEVYTEDVKVGEWSTVKMSGALPADEKRDMLMRVRKLQDAVKVAREEANTHVVTQVNLASNLLTYIIGA